MKTIKDIIKENLAEIEAECELRRDDNIKKVYEQYPSLCECDEALISLRKNRLIAIINNDDKLVERIVQQEEKESQKRARIISDYGIDPNFDGDVHLCNRCKDTGFYKDKSNTVKVCKCKERELKECYANCGLENYSSYDMRNFRDDYLGDAKGRRKILEALLQVMLGVGDLAKNKAQIYYGAPQSGKTYLAVCIVKTAINLGKSACYIKCESLGELSKSEIKEIAAMSLVVIDDFGDDVTLHNNVGSAMNDILEARGAQSLPTIMVTSLPVTDLVKGCDMRIAGKLRNAGVIS